MFQRKLAVKVLAILGMTLTTGFVTMGAIAIWLQINSTMELQLKNARNVAAIIIRDIDEYMMKGDSKEVYRYIEEAKQKKFLLDLKIFNVEGKEQDVAGTGAVNNTVLEALRSGRNIESEGDENGIRTMNVAVPLENELRCQGCHDAGLKYLGGVLLKTSIQDGYDNSRKLTLLLLGTGLFFFVAMLGSIYLFFRKAIIGHILRMARTIDELASGEGDLTQTIPVTSRDEIGGLAQGINTLILKIRDIISHISADAVQLSAAAQQLSATSEQMVIGIQEVSSQTGNVATASEEMAATSCEIANNCVVAADQSQRATTFASTGTEVVERTIAVMERIAAKVQESAATIESLGVRSDQIGEIVGTIEDIADQTNLLALNAAIEAARAGEQGRGFAVVADEVRALAERTTKATREISSMINAIQAETREAVVTMKKGVAEVGEGTTEATKSGDALQEILAQVDAVTSQVSQIAAAAEQQTATTGEISSNIHQITELIHEAERGIRDTASSSAQLAVLGEDLMRQCAQFKQGA
ncbi:MAG: methyl-accepting chemotaxis protein [Geobacteraceae bacterium]